MDYQKLLVEHLDVVDRIVRVAARRHGLSAADADEFGGVVRFKLVDRDFAILRKFQGRSKLSTYLTIVIDRLCLDFCITKWGRWKPSASARRLGPVATLLEQLIVREGITFDEAVGTLQTNHGVSESREELHALFLQLRSRPGAHAAVQQLEDWSLERFPSRAAHPAEQALVDRVQSALAQAIANLAAADREILTLRFDAELPVAQVARSLRMPATTLYRRLTHILGSLREELQRQGIDESDIAHVIGHPSLSMASVLNSETQSSRPTT